MAEIYIHLIINKLNFILLFKLGSFVKKTFVQICAERKEMFVCACASLKH